MVRFATVVVAALTLAEAAASEEFGDAELGAKVFKKCSGCHQVGPDARNRIGPHLNDLFGRRVAGLEDFRYSEDAKRAGANGLEWHAESLDAFLENPRQVISGTRMSFRGLKDPQDRADAIAFLRLYSASPSDYPEADPTSTGTDHALDPAILALEGDVEYGEYLATECVACHQASGADAGIPSITLWPEEDFVLAMHAYKNGVRPHPVMHMIAGRLSAEEIAALAAYFGALTE